MSGYKMKQTFQPSKYNAISLKQGSNIAPTTTTVPIKTF